MREEKSKVLSYLLNNDCGINERISLCNSVIDKFSCEGAYEAVPHIKKSLENFEEAPSLDFLDSECDTDYSSFEQQDISNRADALTYLERDWENKIGETVLTTMRGEIEKEEKDPRKLIRDLKSTLSEFDEKLPGRESKDFMELYRERKEMGEGAKPYNPVIEEYFEEFPLGTISVLCGAPGHMKTTVALHELRKNVFAGKNVAYVSLEMDENKILGRIYSAYSFREEFKGEPFYGMKEVDFVNTNLTEEEERGLEEVIIPAVHERGGNFEILEKEDIEGWRTSGLRSTFSKLDFQPDIVYFDHIHEFSEGDIPQEYVSEKYAGDWLVPRLTNLESDVDGTGTPTHIRVLSQVTQEGQERARGSDDDGDEGEYKQSDILALSKLSQSASLTMFLWATKELLNAEMCKVHITKNRFGEGTESPEMFDVFPGQGRVAEGRNFENQEAEDVSQLDDEKKSELFDEDAQDIQSDIPLNN